MFHVESTERCPRTPVLLFALAEAGLPFEIEIRLDGYFEQNHREPGPRFDAGDGPRIGLSELLDTVRTLPGLRSPSSDEAERADGWFRRLELVRGVMPRLAGAKRAGQEPAAADLAVVRAFTADLEASLEIGPWIGGDTFSSADIALSFVGFLSRVGLPLGPRTRQWLARVQTRPSWQQVVERFPSAAGLAAPA